MTDPTDTSQRPALSRRALGAGLGALALAGCAPSGGVQVGRDDRNPVEGGIGGTGIVGVLTDFGSLIVNGRRVLLSGATRYEGALGTLAADALRTGHSLTVEATGDGAGYVARRVSLSQPLIGQAVQRSGGLRVNGVAVVVPQGIPNSTGSGGRVAVSGLWDGSRVIASRIDVAPAGPDVIAGVPLRGDDGLSVGGVPLHRSNTGAAPRPGGYATLIGQAGPEGFAVAQVQRGRFREPSRLRLLSVEGYLEPVSRRPGYRMSGLGHSFDGAARLQELAGTRALVEGAYDGAFVAARGLVLPQNPGARRDLLRRRLSDEIAERSLR